MSTFDVPDENNHKHFKVRITQEVVVDVDLRTLVCALPEVAELAAINTVHQEVAYALDLPEVAKAYNDPLKGVVAKIIPKPPIDQYLDTEVEVVGEVEDD